MNNKPFEKLETELATLQKRRDTIAADLQAADAAAQTANDALISGTGGAQACSAARAQREALQEAHEAIGAKIETLQAEFETAQKANEKQLALTATAAALVEYDAATLAFEKALRQFMATGKGEAVLQAVSRVRRCENAELRADLRSRLKPSALEYPRPCGNAEIIISQIRAHVSGTQYATSDIPASATTAYADEHPAPVARLSKAGIY